MFSVFFRVSVSVWKSGSKYRSHSVSARPLSWADRSASRRLLSVFAATDRDKTQWKSAQGLLPHPRHRPQGRGPPSATSRRRATTFSWALTSSELKNQFKFSRLFRAAKKHNKFHFQQNFLKIHLKILSNLSKSIKIPLKKVKSGETNQ